MRRSVLPSKPLVIGILFLLVVFGLYKRQTLHGRYFDQPGTSGQRKMLGSVRDWQQREGIKSIVALVFYGRRQQASILDCYLKVFPSSNSYS